MDYCKICEAKTKRQMRARFAVLLSEIAMKFGKVDEALQRSNVGYVAGYYDHATRKRVLEWLNAKHPIFSNPTPEEAFRAGERLGKAMCAKASK